MRKILFILCGMLLFLSCHDKSVYKEPDTDVELLKPYKDLEVIVPEGYASIVKLYGDTLAICPYTTTISIPNLASVSRASFPDAITITLEMKITFIRESYGPGRSLLSKIVETGITIIMI